MDHLKFLMPLLIKINDSIPKSVPIQPHKIEWDKLLLNVWLDGKIENQEELFIYRQGIKILPFCSIIILTVSYSL